MVADNQLVCGVSCRNLVGFLDFYPQDFSSLLDRLSQIVKYLLGICPVDACICNTDAILEPGFALLGYLLVAYSALLAKVSK
jgi:hypothetical protein